MAVADWIALTKWEKENRAICCVVLQVDEVRENISYYDDIDMDKVSDDDIMAAMRHAYDKVEYQDYNAMLDEIHEWLLEIKNERNK